MIVEKQNQIVQKFQAANIETAVLDARLLMMHVLGMSFENYIAHRQSPFPDDLLPILNDAVTQRLSGMPVAKIISEKEFWGMVFKTTTDTLDPRPDSETLIEAVLKHKPERNMPYRVLDLGTGSGCLLITLLYEYCHAVGLGVDQSEKALDVARENACRLNVQERSTWQISDWFTDVTGKFDIIISNPPYIPTHDITNLSVDVRDYDPLSALDGGVSGLDPYHDIAFMARDFLNENGIIAVEFGQGQASDIQDIFEKSGFTKMGLYKDLAGLERCLVFSV